MGNTGPWGVPIMLMMLVEVLFPSLIRQSASPAAVTVDGEKTEGEGGDEEDVGPVGVLLEAPASENKAALVFVSLLAVWGS